MGVGKSLSLTKLHLMTSDFDGHRERYNLALPSLTGSQLYKWWVVMAFFASILTTIYKATTPIETVRVKSRVNRESIKFRLSAIVSKKHHSAFR